MIEQLESRRMLASVPGGFVDTVVASGLQSPSAMDFAPDGRLFVLEQSGSVRVIDNGQLQPTPFVSLNVDSSTERGLLGIALDPNFAANHYVYLYHTVPAPDLHNQVSRFTANGDVAVPGSEVDIFDLDPLDPNHGNHNGGAIHFGPDGKLYIGVGENGTPANAQSLNTTLGKMLRINPDGSIPTDNPFYSQTTGNNRAIWALGLRNPFTFAFQPGTGRMFIDDVGQDTWEEIDDGIAGSNYGWPTTEGPTTDPRFRSPLFAYMHGASSDGGIAITGGTFYDPTTATFPNSFAGTYFFSDLGGGWIHNYNPATNSETSFATGYNQPVDLKVDAQGNLFLLSHGDGTVREISFSSPLPSPRIVTPKAGRLYIAGQRIDFTASAVDASHHPLKASAFSWEVVYFKNGAEKNAVESVSGKRHASFAIPRTMTTANDFYRIILTAMDSFGQSTTVLRDVHPLVANVSILSNPAGAQLEIDGQPISTPATFSGVVGSVHSVAVSPPQSIRGLSYILSTHRPVPQLVVSRSHGRYFLRFRRQF
jgi:glucose/arabinose dehydrogenase